MAYSKDEIEKMIEEARVQQAENGTDTMLENLYKAKFFNYAGKAKGEDRYYTEVIIEYLNKEEIIKNGLISNIKIQPRTAKNPKTGELIYYTPSHENLLKIFDENKKTNRIEETLIKKICKNKTYQDKIGLAIDFQVPLKSEQKDGYGKIDLLTYNEKTNTLYIVEAKRQDSKETLLRACMEIQTYHQIIDSKKLIEDYQKNIPDIVKKVNEVKKAILIFKGSRPSNEYADIENRPNLKQLIKDFDIEVWDLEE